MDLKKERKKITHITWASNLLFTKCMKEKRACQVGIFHKYKEETQPSR